MQEVWAHRLETRRAPGVMTELLPRKGPPEPRWPVLETAGRLSWLGREEVGQRVPEVTNCYVHLGARCPMPSGEWG